MARGTPRPEDGRGEWLSELYQANAHAVESYCRRFLNSAEDAADATHEVFLRALSSLDASPSSGQARSWLITVAQNYCLDMVRRRRRMQVALTTLGAEAGREVESEAQVINRQLLHAVLQQLGERERQALWQSAVERRTLTEIASYLGMSYMAAAQLVHRARKHASVVAARLATVLGLAAANSMRRRSPVLTFAQSLAAVATMPLVVVAVATPSSNAQVTPVVRPAAHRLVSPATPGAGTAANGSGLPSDGEAGPASRMPPSRTVARQPVNSTLSNVHQVLQQLTGSVSLPNLPAATSPPATVLPSPLGSPLPSPLGSPLPSPLGSPLPSPLPTPSMPKPTGSTLT